MPRYSQLSEPNNWNMDHHSNGAWAGMPRLLSHTHSWECQSVRQVMVCYRHLSCNQRSTQRCGHAAVLTISQIAYTHRYIAMIHKHVCHFCLVAAADQHSAVLCRGMISQLSLRIGSQRLEDQVHCLF